MAYDFNGTTQVLETTITVPLGGVPNLMAMSCWVNLDGVTGTDYVLAIAISTAIDRYSLGFRRIVFPVAGWFASFSARSTSAAGIAEMGIPGGNPLASGWRFICGNNKGAADHNVYMDDSTNTAQDTTSVSPNLSANDFSIGARVSNGVTSNWVNGQIAEVAIWSDSLQDFSIDQLAAGVSPLFIQETGGGQLVYYAPLIATPNDLVGGIAMTETNSPTVVDHDLRVFRPG